MTEQEWTAEVQHRISINEGYRNTKYLDSVGVPTIGVGYNLLRSDAREELASIGADYDAVMAGAELSDEQVAKLFEYSLTPIVSDARSSLEPTHFDNMSDARRFVLCDLVFNLGLQGWLDFANTRGLIDKACHFKAVGDQDSAHDHFVAAADELASSAYAAQVGNRAKRNAAMLRSSGWVDAQGDGTY
jgi:GH24 family phage-related lysozyme (muramidase)